MRQAMCRPFHQIVTLAPGQGCEASLKFDVCLQIRYAKGRQASKDLLTRLIANLFPILLSRLANMTDRYDIRQGILLRRRHGCVEPRRSVDIKTWVGRQTEVVSDAVEILAIIIS